MIVSLHFNGTEYCSDLTKPIDISIPLQAGTENPNCYHADPVLFKTIRQGKFVGSVAQGGSVNYQSITITPHGNGTHTECYGHLSADPAGTINQSLKHFHFIAQLITVKPVLQSNGDLVIQLQDVQPLLLPGVEAVIIRTLPNEPEKKQRQYTNTNPPYFEAPVMEYLRQQQVKHFLTDLPSVDREVDGGALKSHRAFWSIDGIIRKESSITELIYVDNKITDGIYLLNLQIISLEADASPSKPIIFKCHIC